MDVGTESSGNGRGRPALGKEAVKITLTPVALDLLARHIENEGGFENRSTLIERCIRRVLAPSLNLPTQSG